jgi:hypothetical protein
MTCYIDTRIFLQIFFNKDIEMSEDMLYRQEKHSSIKLPSTKPTLLQPK